MSAPDPDIDALRICVETLQRLSPRLQRATIEYLRDRFVLHPPENPQALARRARAILEEAAHEDPAARWQAMIDAGLIDSDGRVLCCGPGKP